MHKKTGASDSIKETTLKRKIVANCMEFFFAGVEVNHKVNIVFSTLVLGKKISLLSQVWQTEREILPSVFLKY